IRDKLVTGVQTCALPISLAPKNVFALNGFRGGIERAGYDAATDEIVAIDQDKPAHRRDAVVIVENERAPRLERDFAYFVDPKFEIGRASCRERVEDWVGA